MLRRVTTIVLFVVPIGCIEHFDTPSAYQDQPVLCSGVDRELFEQQVAECRRLRDAGDRCEGVISVEGAAEDTPFKFTAPMGFAELELWDRESFPEGEIRSIILRGHGPYFNYLLKIRSEGISYHDLPVEASRTFVLPQEHAIEHRDDARLTLRLDSIGHSLRVESNSNTVGQLELTLQSQREYGGRLEASFGDSVLVWNCCFHAFISVLTSRS